MAGRKVLRDLGLCCAVAVLGMMVLAGAGFAAVDPGSVTWSVNGDECYDTLFGIKDAENPDKVEVLFRDPGPEDDLCMVCCDGAVVGLPDTEANWPLGDVLIIRAVRGWDSMAFSPYVYLEWDVLEGVPLENNTFWVEVSEDSIPDLRLTSFDDGDQGEKRLRIDFDLGEENSGPKVLSGTMFTSSDIGTDECDIVVAMVEPDPTFDITVLGMENMDDPTPDVLLELETVTSTDVSLELDKAPAPGDRVVVLVRNWWRNEIWVSESEAYTVPKNYFADFYAEDDQEPVEFTVFDTNNIGSATMGAIVSGVDASGLNGEFAIDFIDSNEESLGTMTVTWPENSGGSGGGCSVTGLASGAFAFMLPLLYLLKKN